MADDASQRKFQTVTVKTFTPLPFSVRFLILLNVVAVGRRRCTRPSIFPPTLELETKTNILTKKLTSSLFLCH
jgi:hypothetical protein